MSPRHSLAAVLWLGGLCGCQSGPGGPGAGIPGTPVTAEQRQAVFNSVSTTLAGRRVDDPAAARDALVAMFMQDTAIEDAGISDDGSVWARFTDNKLVIVAMNNPTEVAWDAPPPSSLGNRARIEDLKRRPPAAAARTKQSQTKLDSVVSLPSSIDFHLLNGYADAYDGVETHLANLTRWLERRGYSDRTSAGHGATLAKLKFENAGVFYFHGHAGIGFLREDEADPDSATYPVYGLGTLQFLELGETAEIEYYLNTRQIGYLVMPTVGTDPIDVVLKFRPIASTAYFITKDFVKNHWSFSPGSWVYIDACGSFDQGFREACISVGASVYLGWTSSVRHVDAQETSEYLFSRLLGMNDLGSAKYVMAESPPQRPFPLEDMLSNIEHRPRTTVPDLSVFNPTLRESFSLHSVGRLSGGSWTARLEPHLAGNVSEPLLVPSIQQLFIEDQPSIVHDEPNILIIAGSFGVEEPHVYVGDDEAEVIEARPSSLVCRTSSTAHGPVTVQVSHYFSPARMLTKWSGFAGQLNTLDTGAPTESLQLSIRFRGDLQSVRTEPGEVPKYVNVPTCEGIPGECNILVADRFGTLPCPPGKTGAGYKWETPGFGNLPVMRVGSPEDHIWVQKGDIGATVNEATGEIEGLIVFGVFKNAGVRQTGDCTFEPPVDAMIDLSISGGVYFTMSKNNYDIDETFTTDSPPHHAFSELKVTAESVPSDNDLR